MYFLTRLFEYSFLVDTCDIQTKTFTQIFVGVVFRKIKCINYRTLVTLCRKFENKSANVFIRDMEVLIKQPVA